MIITSVKDLFGITLQIKIKIHLDCDCIEGIVLKGELEPTFFRFVLDKLPGYQVLCEPERKLQKKQINRFCIL